MCGVWGGGEVYSLALCHQATERGAAVNRLHQAKMRREEERRHREKAWDPEVLLVGMGVGSIIINVIGYK